MKLALNSNNIPAFGLIIALLVPILGSCTSDEYGSEVYNPYHCLRFLKTSDFQMLQKEVLSVSSSAQTIELTLQEVTDPNIPFPTALYPKVYEWDEENSSYKEIGRFDTPANFYKAYTKEENKSTTVYIDLDENNQLTDRKLFLCIFSASRSTYKKHSVSIGYVEIIQHPASEASQSFSLKAKYKDRVYTTDAEIDLDGNICYLDPEYSSLMNKLDDMEDIQMMIMDDTTIFYYDKEDILSNQPYEDILSLEPSDIEYKVHDTRADGFEYDDPSYLGYFAIYDNDNFKGSKITQGLTNFHFTHNIQSLKTYSMNDIVTSIAVGYNSDDSLVCSVLTVWEDTDYNYGDDNRSKHRISIIASKNSPKTTIPDLKKIKRIGSSKSWNDCISSISFHFGYIDRLLLDY